MSYKIDPDGYCIVEGCSRPRLAGEELCSICLIQVTDPDAVTRGAAPAPSQVAPEVAEPPAEEAKLPRCVAYLSKAGDVITLELTGEPKFTEADVELVAAALSNMRKVA
jgi:hypothetical protein